MSKDFLFGREAREKLFEGIDLMYKCVSATYGSFGRNVLIDIQGHNIVELTKDGVSVANRVQALDTWQDMGCKLLRAASQKSNEEAGDGTSAAVILGWSLCKDSLDLPRNCRVISVKNGISKAVDICTEELKKMSKKISKEDEFRNVATVSAQDEEVGKIVAKAFIDSGKHGSIQIERSDEVGIQVEHTDGISFEKGFVIPHCINNPAKMEAVQEEVPILVTDRAIKSQYQLVPLLDSLAKKQINKILIIADDFKGDTLGMIAANNDQKAFHIIPVRAPSYGVNKIEIMKDICEATGATFISEENQGMRLEQTTAENLGKVRKVTVGKDTTVLVSEGSVEIKKRISDRILNIETQLKDEKDEMKVEDLKTRLATLTDGITVLKVGGHTEQERRELTHRVDDAVKSVQSSAEEGVVPGCGVALLKCIESLRSNTEATLDADEILGVRLVEKSLYTCALKLLEVADVPEKEHIVVQMKESGLGYDFKKNCLADMMKLGIWDSTKVIRCALQNAASVAKNFLSTDVCISEMFEDTKVLKDFLGLVKEAKA